VSTPAVERGRKSLLFGEVDRPVERDPTHQLRENEVEGLASDLPDPRIRFLPDFGNVVDDLTDRLPVGLGQCDSRACCFEDGQQELAVDVELALVGGLVADPDRLGVPVAREMAQGLFGKS